MDKSKKDIKHSGIIRKVTDDFYYVAVERTAACQGCAAKNFCNIHSNKNEFIPVQRLPHQTFITGDEVTIALTEKLGWKALFYGYMMPFVALIAGIIVAAVAKLPQGVVGFIGIGALVVYYVVFSFFSKKVDKQFYFRIG